MVNLHTETLKNPYNVSSSNSMQNFLGRFCSRTEREYDYYMLAEHQKITYEATRGYKKTVTVLLLKKIMKRIMSYVTPSNIFIEREFVICDNYRNDCLNPRNRCFCHTYPEIKAILSLMRIYNTSSAQERNVDFLNVMFPDDDTSLEEDIPESLTHTPQQLYRAFITDMFTGLDQLNQRLFIQNVETVLLFVHNNQDLENDKQWS